MYLFQELTSHLQHRRSADPAQDQPQPGEAVLLLLQSGVPAGQVVQYGVKTIAAPSALERRGDFSQSKNTNGALVSVRDPYNNETPFPWNVIQADSLTQDITY
jgi:hypothetical protein